MIAEHPDLLAAESTPATVAGRPARNCELRVLSSFNPAETRWLRDEEQPVQVVRHDNEDEADHRDMRRLIAGQEQALQSLMERYKDSLNSQLVRVLRNRTEAQEIAL